MTRLFTIMAILASAIALAGMTSLFAPRKAQQGAIALVAANASPSEHGPDGDSHDEEEAKGGVVRMTPEQIAAAEIDVGEVTAGVLASGITAPGTVTLNADKIARVPAKVVGTVAQLNKRLGDSVRKGEIVAILDSREVADAKSAYLTAAVNFDLRKTMFERSQALWDKKVTTEQLHLQSRATYDEAKLHFDLARQKLTALNIDANEVAALARKDASNPEALNLREYEIRSPVSGRVVERKVDQGMAVGSEGDPSDLYTVADLASMWVELAVPTSELEAIREGQRVRISAGRDAGKEGEGRIIFVSPLLNQETRSARVIAEIDNKALIWRAGSFVTAEIMTRESPVAARAPRLALQTMDGEKVAFVRTPEGFQRRDLTIGKADDQSVEVISGLSAGDRIAVTNTFLLKAELGKSEAGHGH